MRYAALITLPLMLAACGQGKAPSEQLKDAAQQAVEDATGTAPPQLGDGPIAPRDECQDIKGSDIFRQQLAIAVEARDTDALVAMASPDIKLDFGDGAGRDELRRRLEAEDGRLWSELDQLLTLGCGPSGAGGLVLPWYWSKGLDDVDPASEMIVTGDNVPLRQSASADGATIASVSWDAVELVGGLQTDTAYQQVKTRDGQTGFMATKMLRSVLDYRLFAASRDGVWSITSIVVGD